MTARTLEAFARTLDPSQTVLFLGAGASIPSGAPSGRGLGESLARALGDHDVDGDFNEVCSLLEYRHGREALVKAIRRILERLQPDSGMRGLPCHEWHSIFSTNFDQIVERAYRSERAALVVIRSNYEYAALETKDGTPYFKIHGCISQDAVDGHAGRMVLTERDIETHAQYREALFDRLRLDLLTKNVLLVGHSLKDPHLRAEMTRASELQRHEGAPGRLIALIHEPDEDRRALWEGKGFEVVFGALDELLDLVITPPADETHAKSAGSIPRRLRSRVTDVRHASALGSDALRLFNGSPATFADIAAGLTFARSPEAKLRKVVLLEGARFLSIIGLEGVGKTTLARRLLKNLSDEGWSAWEHRGAFPLRVRDWIAVDEDLRAQGSRGVLLLDDCHEYIRLTSKLIDALPNGDGQGLHIVMTANTTQWTFRAKSPRIFSEGVVEPVSSLSSEDVDALLHLVDREERIRELMDTTFSSLSRDEQRRRLRVRCSADMYVCLKNVFGSDELDTILLREFATLADELRDIYRHVSALEAAGAKVHRQLILRVVGISGQDVSNSLARLDGIIDEFDVSPKEGLYGWCTRHKVIATTIARWKFADQQELFQLLRRVIEGLNPTVQIELQTLRHLCLQEMGIKRLTSWEDQVQLYELISQIVPGERIPRHRLITVLLRAGQLDRAGQAVRQAEEDLGEDPILLRYRVKLAMSRAENSPGLLPEDRGAMLREAQSIAVRSIDRYGKDKFPYITYAEVAAVIADKLGDSNVLVDAVDRMREASERLLDPHLVDQLANYESLLRRVQQLSTIVGSSTASSDSSSALNNE